MKLKAAENFEPSDDRRIISLEQSTSGNKQHIAYEYLKESIISGKYPPEKPLIERELCDALGVSRTPVREALRRLTSEGLAESFPGRGVFVSRVNPEKATQLYELKEALEGMAARLCTERMSDEEIQELRECLQAHTEALENDEMAATADLDLRFHVLLIEGARSPMLEQQAKGILLQTRRLAQLSVYDPDSTTKFIAQHTAIYEAIRSRDAEEAEKALSAHISAIKKFQRERWKLLF